MLLNSEFFGPLSGSVALEAFFSWMVPRMMWLAISSNPFAETCTWRKYTMSEQNQRIPVTILTGFLGSGKVSWCSYFFPTLSKKFTNEPTDHPHKPRPKGISRQKSCCYWEWVWRDRSGQWSDCGCRWRNIRDSKWVVSLSCTVSRPSPNVSLTRSNSICCRVSIECYASGLPTLSMCLMLSIGPRRSCSYFAWTNRAKARKIRYDTVGNHRTRRPWPCYSGTAGYNVWAEIYMSHLAKLASSLRHSSWTNQCKMLFR